MSFQNDLFNKIQQNSNINQNDVYAIANSVKNADFSDETTVRQLVRQLAQLANKPISQQKEDEIVASITNNKVPADINSLSQLFKK